MCFDSGTSDSRIASSISAESSRYVNRISPSSGPAGAPSARRGESGTRRCPPPSGACTIWHVGRIAASSRLSASTGSAQIGAGALMP